MGSFIVSKTAASHTLLSADSPLGPQRSLSAEFSPVSQRSLSADASPARQRSLMQVGAISPCQPVGAFSSVLHSTYLNAPVSYSCNTSFLDGAARNGTEGTGYRMEAPVGECVVDCVEPRGANAHQNTRRRAE